MMALATPHSEPLFHGIIDHEVEPVKRILTAAERCLWESGYGGMSIRDVADRAGVSKSLLHYHFMSKEHLFLEVQIGVYNRLAAGVTAAVVTIGSAPDRTLLAFDALFEALKRANDLPVQAEIWARSLTNPKLRRRAAELREYLRNIIISTLRAILGPSVEALPLSPGAAADLLLAAVTGLGLQAGVEDSPERIDEAFAALRKLVELALVRPTPEVL
jgi:AcrR family transcriptional regulator